VTLTRADGAVTVDLHWQITPSFFHFPLDFDVLLPDLHEVQLAEEPIPSMGPEDHLVVLCVHAAKHAWHQLLWVCDVAHLVASHPDFDWERLRRRATRFRARRAVALGLILS